MALTIKTPGVYVEEVPTFPPSVAAVDTAIPAFIGYTQRRGEKDKPALPTTTIVVGADNIPVTNPLRITTFLEYVTYFGTGPDEAFTVTINDSLEPLPSTKVSKRAVAVALPAPSKHTMFYHMQMYFANGGGPCYIVSVGDTSDADVDAANLKAGLELIKQYDEPTLLVFPESNGMAVGDMYDVYDLALNQSAALGDRFVIMDCHGDNAATLRVGATGIGNNDLKYGAAYHPYLKTSLNYVYNPGTIIITHKVNADRSNDGTFEANGDMNTEALSAQNSEVQSLLKAELDKFRVTLPPCSSIAGIYAYVDGTRGVWKAPANVSLNNVNGLTKNITDEENGNLNIDPNGKSINAIRIFTGKGILVWGARTLAGNDNEWRYVPVRRLFNMVEESCKKASGQFVFEPNDANTWTKVRAMISNFLTVLWRQGALAGAKPEQAFYVACGLGTTMTALDILEGRLIVEIGMAAVRPAEFIILRFSHKMQES